MIESKLVLYDFRILVGAPRDNITDNSAPSQVKNLKSPGAVWSCPVSSFTDDCEEVKIDREGEIGMNHLFVDFVAIHQVVAVFFFGGGAFFFFVKCSLKCQKRENISMLLP